MPFSPPAGATGDWTLGTAITATGNRLSGTGTLTLSNGRVLTYQIIGTYNTRSGAAKLKLVGESDATGSSLSLTTQGTTMTLSTLKGKVLGQTPTVPQPIIPRNPAYSSGRRITGWCRPDATPTARRSRRAS